MIDHHETSQITWLIDYSFKIPFVKKTDDYSHRHRPFSTNKSL